MKVLKPNKAKPAKRKTRKGSSRHKVVPGLGLTEREMDEMAEEIVNEIKNDPATPKWWPGDPPRKSKPK